LTWAQASPAIASNSWEFWSLVAGLVYLAVTRWIDKQAVLDAAKDASHAAQLAASKADVMAQKQDDQHAATNSRLSELLKQTEIAAHAAGLAAGVKQEQDRIAAKVALEKSSGPIEVTGTIAIKEPPTPEQRLEEIRGETY
jgi:hypothetical protein